MRSWRGERALSGLEGSSRRSMRVVGMGGSESDGVMGYLLWVNE